jgi:serine/threonine protein phosphatase PrpC
MTRIENRPIISEFGENKPSVVVDFGDVSVQGRRWEMEDSHTIIPEFRGNPGEFFAGVYDGHAGRLAADLIAERLHLNLASLLEENAPEEALRKAFILTDEEVAKTGIKDGATVVAAYIDGANLYVANAGDARAVLGRGIGAKRLSHDHKANDPKEVRRIKKLGGHVTSKYETGIPRVNGILAISRSIGDHSDELDGFISPEPFITHTVLEPQDHALILACDGIWDVIKDDEVAKIVRDINGSQNAAEFLMNEAINNRRSRDNVTVVVVKLSVPVGSK